MQEKRNLQYWVHKHKYLWSIPGYKWTRNTRVQLAKIFASTSKQTENTLSLQLQVSVILSCAYSVFLNTRGYINVIDELCMRAQLPLYSPRGSGWEGSSNRLRLKTKRSHAVCGDHWNAREVSSNDHISELCSFPDIR